MSFTYALFPYEIIFFIKEYDRGYVNTLVFTVLLLIAIQLTIYIDRFHIDILLIKMF